MEKRELDNIPMLALAYIGDAVYELRVRELLVAKGVTKVGELHAKSVDFVSAAAQSVLLHEIEDILTEEEKQIFRRGRNAKSGHQPPNTTVGAYRRATGLEALIGYLYLAQKVDRLEIIFERLFAQHII